MWMKILELLMKQQLGTGHEAPDSKAAKLAFRLLEQLVGIQSETSSSMSDAENALADFESNRELLDAASRRVAGSAGASDSEWLSMVYLSELLYQLESRWDGYYVPVFRVYPEMGRRIDVVVRYLRAAPFSACLESLAATWRPEESEALRNTIASVYVATCAQRGAVEYSNEMSTAVVGRLRFSEPFFLTAVCAYCVRVLAACGRVDVRLMTQEQYDCMALLDNFYSGPEGAWG